VLSYGSSSWEQALVLGESTDGGEELEEGELARFSEEEEIEKSTTDVVEETTKSQGFNLEVVLHFDTGTNTQSGVNLLLSEDSLQDVEGYKVARENPEAKILEAQKLLCEQKKVGFSFDQNEEAPIGKMVDMEVRDRVECSKRQGSSCPQ
jgi:hypothetical protein